MYVMSPTLRHTCIDMPLIPITPLPPSPLLRCAKDAISRTAAYAHVHFVSVDVDKFEDIAAAHSIVGVPVFVAYRGQKEHSRLQGSGEEELKAFLKTAAA